MIKMMLFFNNRFSLCVLIAVLLSFLVIGYSGQSTNALTTAETTSKIKTTIFHVLDSQAVVTNGSSLSGDFTVFVGEQAPIIKSALIEVEGVTKANSGQVLTIDIKQQGVGSFPSPRAQSFTINSSGKDNSVIISYHGNDTGGNDLTSYFAGIMTNPSPYVFTLKADVNGADISLLKAKLIITYQYTPPVSGGTVPNSNTTSFSVFQNQSIVSTPGSISQTFSIFVGEPSPIIKNAYLLVNGVTKPVSNQAITIDIKQSSDSFPTPRAKTFTLNASGQSALFSILYLGNDTGGNDLTNYLAGIITAPTEYTFTVKIDTSGADISLLNARLVITYQFTQNSGGYPATGNVVSSTFDTLTTNGSTFNSIGWKGIKPVSTRVRLQLATSNNAAGPFNFIGGLTCTSNDFYEPDPDNEAALKCFSLFNNKRYYQYKIILCSSNDCSTSGSQTPQVNDIMINWSP